MKEMTVVGAFEAVSRPTALLGRRSQLAVEYETALRGYLEGSGGLALEPAHQLGQQALALGLGALDVALVHHEALVRTLPFPVDSDACAVAVQAAAKFLVATMTPLQAAYLGYRERLEEEVRRIAHSLHDEAGQLLASVYLAIAELARDLPPQGRKQLAHVCALLDQVTDQLRRISHELRPVLLDDLGLVPAIEFLARSVSKRTGLIVTIEASTGGRLPAAVETALYRILQETLTNVSKHARARRVSVRLRQTQRVISYSIRDDGVGFDPRVVARNTHKPGLGLDGIRSRLADLGGTLSIKAGTGRGTTLDIRIPVPGSPIRESRAS